MLCSAWDLFEWRRVYSIQVKLFYIMDHHRSSSLFNNHLLSNPMSHYYHPHTGPRFSTRQRNNGNDSAITHHVYLNCVHNRFWRHRHPILIMVNHLKLLRLYTLILRHGSQYGSLCWVLSSAFKFLGQYIKIWRKCHFWLRVKLIELINLSNYTKFWIKQLGY